MTKAQEALDAIEAWCVDDQGRKWFKFHGDDEWSTSYINEDGQHVVGLLGHHPLAGNAPAVISTAEGQS